MTRFHVTRWRNPSSRMTWLTRVSRSVRDSSYREGCSLRDVRSCDLSSPAFAALDGSRVVASAECVARRGTGGGGMVVL